MLWLRLRGADRSKSRKKEEEKNNNWETQGEGSDAKGREGEGRGDGGEQGKHGSHYGGDLAESEGTGIMCESIELLSVIILSAPRK